MPNQGISLAKPVFDSKRTKNWFFCMPQFSRELVFNQKEPKVKKIG